MTYCWKCGEKLQEEGSCPVCGATPETRRPLPADASAEARAMRRIYDSYGCKQALTQPAVLYNGLGDLLGEDGRKLRNQVRTALNAGLGKLYLTELTEPMYHFDRQALRLLTEEGFTEETARHIKSLFDEMTGRPVAEEPAPMPEPGPTPVPKPEPVRPTPAQGTPAPTSSNQATAYKVVLIAVIAVMLIAVWLVTHYRGGNHQIVDKSQWGELYNSILLDDLWDVFGSDYHIHSIRSITFLNSTRNKPDDAWDVSCNQNGTVWAWITDAGVSGYYAGNDNPLYDLFIAGDGGVKLPQNSGWLFGYYSNVISINFNNCVDTSNVTSMQSMFTCCYALTSLDLSSFNTSNVTNMNGMFSGCSSLTIVKVPRNFIPHDASTDQMFKDCPLTSISEFKIID